MNIIIFGGAGFLGSHLCDCLLAKGHKVVVYDRKVDKYPNIEHLGGKVQLIQGGFEQAEHFDEILKNVDVVFHLISATVPSNNDPLLDIHTTVKPTIKLLNSCVKNKIKKVVFFSSGGTVYGIPRFIPITEQHPTNPISAYGVQKLTIEKYLEYYRAMFNLNYSILRIANPYGERQQPFGVQGLIANMLGKHFTGEEIEIWGDGSVVRDFIFVSDLTDIACKLLSYYGEEKIFNIGSGQGCSIKEIIFVIEKVLQTNLNVKYTAARKQDVPVNVLDIQLAMKTVNWKPCVSLETGIARMIKAWNPHERNFRG